NGRPGPGGAGGVEEVVDHDLASGIGDCPDLACLLVDPVGGVTQAPQASVEGILATLAGQTSQTSELTDLPQGRVDHEGQLVLALEVGQAGTTPADLLGSHQGPVRQPLQTPQVPVGQTLTEGFLH